MSGGLDRDGKDTPPNTQHVSVPVESDPEDGADRHSDESATEGWDNEGGHDVAHLVNE